MPTPTAITDLSQTASSNYPAGGDSPATLDDVQRAHASFIALLRDGKGQTTPVSLASATTTDIGAQNSTFVEISGTTTITSFGTNYTGVRFLRFAAALTLTHNASSLILPTAANITTAANDTAIAVPVQSGSGWAVISYMKANGTALVSPTDFLNTTRIDVASATTTDLTASAPNTRHINITGTATITGFTVAAGQCYFARFAGILTLTNNAAIITQTGANITTAAGDTCILRATAANTVEVLAYSPAGLVAGTATPLASGTASAGSAIPYSRQDHVHPEPNSVVQLNTSNGYGSTNTCIRRFTTTVLNQGTDITYADSATLGATFTINKSGMYAISFNDSLNTQNTPIGVSVNSSQLTTSILSITVANRLTFDQTYFATAVTQCSWAGYLNSGDVIRAHNDGTATSNAALCAFTIAKV